jgi:hypothetical protein
MSHAEAESPNGTFWQNAASTRFSPGTAEGARCSAIALPRLVVLVGGLTLCLLLSCSNSTEDQAREKKEKSDEKQKADKAATKSIPLAKLYSTNGQEGVIHVNHRVGEPHTLAFDAIYIKMEGMGASNIFLVYGDDLASAMSATLNVLDGLRSADTPARRDNAKTTKQLWLVAYFGSAGAGPPAWLIESVEQKGNHVRLTYSEPQGQESTLDVHPYFVWVPLGSLESGDYALELFKVDATRPSMVRHVTVSSD